MSPQSEYPCLVGNAHYNKLDGPASAHANADRQGLKTV